MHTCINCIYVAAILAFQAMAWAQSGPASQSSPDTPRLPRVNSVDMHLLPVYHAGRIMPLDTLARQTIRDITGSRSWNKSDPVILLLAWTWQGDLWKNARLIPVTDRALRDQLALPADRDDFSYAELTANPQWPAVARAAVDQTILHRVQTLDAIFQGRSICFVPPTAAADAQWTDAASIDDPAVAEKILPLWANLRQAYIVGDNDAFRQTATALTAELKPLYPANWPQERRNLLAMEVLTNFLRPLQKGYWATLAALGLALLSLTLPIKWRTWGTLAAWGALLNGLSLLTLMLILRWKFTSHLPATTFEEIIVLMGWVVVVIAAAFMLRKRRNAHLPALAALATLATLILFLADTIQ